jgi:hypothetical protein
MSCLKRLAMAAIVLFVVALAWLYRDRVHDALRVLAGRDPATAAAAPVASPEIAAAARDRLERLGSTGADRAALSHAELQSLLTWEYPQLLPGFVHEPRIEISRDQLRLSARLPAERIPRLEDLRELAVLLPDTTDVTLTARLLPLGEGRAALAIEGIQVARVPIPRRLLPAVLDRLGRRAEPGLPADAVAVPLPPGVASAYLRGDSLILLPRTTRAQARPHP